MKKFTLLLVAVIATVSAFADQLTPGQALSRMAQNARSKGQASINKYELTYTAKEGSVNTFYAFNNTDGGYVLLSADDCMPAVLGVVDKGTFNMDKIPSNMKWYLASLSKSVVYNMKNGVASPAKVLGAKIDPLLNHKYGSTDEFRIQFGQDSPFSDLTPTYKEDGEDIHCATGCVATAMAQVMAYWQYPTKGTGSKTYSFKMEMTPGVYATTATKITYNFGEKTFDWANILQKYCDVDYTEVQGAAVAELLYACGVAAEMTYGTEAANGSAATSDVAAKGMSTYLGYSKDIKVITKDNYTQQAWEEAIYNELKNGRPVIFGGSTNEEGEGGHEFVGDGYDGNGKFHINWGWDGDSNGFFAMTNTGMAPGGSGTGGASESSSYGYLLEAIVGIQPDGLNEKIDNGPAKEQWSKIYDGADETVPQYPDLYSHYWQYVWSTKNNPNMVLKVHGAYPHCTYFSFSLYNDADGSVINGSSDYEIKPDAGSVNPFVETSTKENYYTVYIVPETISDAKLAELGANANIIKVKSTVEQANIMIRQYLSVDQNGTPDTYGGVDMPSIQAYDITTMKEVKAPKTLDGNVNTNIPAFKERPEIDDRTDIPFLLYPTTGFYPNSATNYLYARTKVKDDQVLTFTFIPTPTPTKVEEYKDEKARYWSICLGSCMDTRSYCSINHKQANVKEGEKVTFVICTKQNAKLAEIQKRVEDEKAKGNNWQILVWDTSKLSYFARTEGRKDANGNLETIGNTMIIMYRNILPDKTWEHCMAKMTPISLYNLLTAAQDPQNCIAKYALGDYGPQGSKVSNDEFLLTNDINSLTTEAQTSKAVYNVMGQRVNGELKHGMIYIINGKKFINK